MVQQKVIGMIGGIAPPSTIDYYQKIIAGFQTQAQTNHYPSILINSIDMTKMLSFVSAKQFDELVVYLFQEIEKLKLAGAEIAFLASNTPHIVFNELQKKSIVPLISIVQACIDHAKQNGYKKLGLFGTKSTMQGGFYQAGFAQHKIDLVIPILEQQEYIHEKYMSELVKGIYSGETKKQFVNIAIEMQQHSYIDGLILGGTELPLLLHENDIPSLPLLNTTEIHVASILAHAMKN
jgi:aspartate racemase